MDTNDLGPVLCDQLGFSRLDFGAWNNVMRNSRNCCKVRAVSSMFRWKIKFMRVSLCDSLRSAMTRAIKAERLSEMGKRLTLPLLCVLHTLSMADCLMASVASGSATPLRHQQRLEVLQRHQPNLGELQVFLDLGRQCVVAQSELPPLHCQLLVSES